MCWFGKIYGETASVFHAVITFYISLKNLMITSYLEWTGAIGVTTSIYSTKTVLTLLTHTIFMYVATSS